jgi:hypothetical protein
VDPITARRVLRIFPDAPLTVELVERAFAGESSARHPSRYPEGAARRGAEEWAQTLSTARDLLLAEARARPTAVADAATAPSTRRRLSAGAIAGIAAGGLALLALITFAAIGAANLATQAVTAATEVIESEAAEAESGGSGETELADVERYQSGETMYDFSAALEIYNDGRYSAECPFTYAQGCWQMALFTDADCDAMVIELGFTNDVDAILPDKVETLEKQDVLGNEATVVVFGNDDYAYGWINQVTCLDDAN